MRFLDFKTALRDFPIFSLADIKNFDTTFDRRRLHEWQAKGYIQKVIRGYYRFADNQLDEHTLFLIANKIYSPSYISLEMGLSYYHLIPESVYTVTSVSTAKSQALRTPLGTFAYQSMKPDLFFGITFLAYQKTQVQIGEVEKVLLDYLYFHPELKTRESIEGLRLNQDELVKQVNWQKLEQYTALFQNQTLEKRVKLLEDRYA